MSENQVEFFWPQFTQIEHYSLWFRLNRRVLQKIWIIVMSCGAAPINLCSADRTFEPTSFHKQYFMISALEFIK